MVEVKDGRHCMDQVEEVDPRYSIEHICAMEEALKEVHDAESFNHLSDRELSCVGLLHPTVLVGDIAAWVAGADLGVSTIEEWVR